MAHLHHDLPALTQHHADEQNQCRPRQGADKCIEEKTLTCTNCGEIYEVSENNPYANCPYCDSRGEKHAKIRRYTEPSK